MVTCERLPLLGKGIAALLLINQFYIFQALSVPVTNSDVHQETSVSANHGFVTTIMIVLITLMKEKMFVVSRFYNISNRINANISDENHQEAFRHL